MWQFLIPAAASLIGGERRNQAQAEQAAAANAFSAEQYAKRWQTTVKDMGEAGLNPMLAYSQGVGTSPSGQQASVEDTITPAVQTYQQAKINSAQVANVNADTTVKEAQAANTRADTFLKIAQESFYGASADQSRANVNYLESQSKKIVEEIKNIPIEGKRLEALVKNLNEEFSLIKERVGTQEQATNQMRWLAVKTMLESDLISLDVQAAKKFDALGAQYKQVGPVLDFLKSLMFSTRR